MNFLYVSEHRNKLLASSPFLELSCNMKSHTGTCTYIERCRALFYLFQSPSKEKKE